MIRGVDYGAYVDGPGLRATNNVNPRQDSMSFTLWLNGELAMPRAGMEVVWGRYDADTGDEVEREYAGIITEVSERVEGGALVYEVSCQPYNRWFDRRLLKGFTQQKRADDVIKELVAKYAPDFDTTHVVAPPIIISQHYNYQRLSKAIQMICDQIGYAWYVDHYRKVHVFERESFASPLPNNILDVDNDMTSYGDLVLTENSEEVYNKYTIRGFKVRGTTPVDFYYRGDGTTTQWTLGYRISSFKGDQQVWVDGVEYTVKRDYIEGAPGDLGDPGVAYMHFTQHLVRFATAPADGALIHVRAIPLEDKVYSQTDATSVNYMRDLEQSTDGVYEYAEQDKSLSQSTMSAVKAKVEGLATKYGLPVVSGSFVSYLPGWRAGQMFRLVSANRFGGEYNAERPMPMYVYRVTKRWMQQAHPHATAPWNSTPIEYTIEFADRPNIV